VAVVFRASWPDERIIRATLGTIVAEVQKTDYRSHRAYSGRRGAGGADFRDSALYDSAYQRRSGGEARDGHEASRLSGFSTGEGLAGGAGPGDPDF